MRFVELKRRFEIRLANGMYEPGEGEELRTLLQLADYGRSSAIAWLLIGAGVGFGFALVVVIVTQP